MASKINSVWKNISVIIGLWLAVSSVASASPTVGATRLVFDGAKHESSITVRNGDDTAYLIQSWADAKGADGKKADAAKPPFMITPPLFRMEAKSANQLRVIRTGGDLPEDRESVFWMNIKAIPPSDPDAKNTLQFAINTRIKLFFRPAGLPDIKGAAWQNVSFERRGKQLFVTNPLPFYLTFSRLSVGVTDVVTTGVMVPPKGTASYTLPAAANGKVSWALINDYGGASPLFSAVLGDGSK
ncbi:P pilus assembly chaperone PapD [Sinobacterium caligoides]|uniref:P pilus assembly chaperone PapD n=1 Tax=Sinobacterium caligoides TaxID=933926 RepID=A0A3N2DN19_9GAMM|nr:molecular chaperone [Sinobacterium caligoides]ROS01072.1 P pilus assembly chaperone PapD [Sinobacterium caligoides]